MKRLVNFSKVVMDGNNVAASNKHLWMPETKFWMSRRKVHICRTGDFVSLGISRSINIIIIIIIIYYFLRNYLLAACYTIGHYA
jgi:hypothetical protein